MDGISAGFIVQKLADQGKVPFLQLQPHLNILLFEGGVCDIAPGGGVQLSSLLGLKKTFKSLLIQLSKEKFITLIYGRFNQNNDHLENTHRYYLSMLIIIIVYTFLNSFNMKLIF